MRGHPVNASQAPTFGTKSEEFFKSLGGGMAQTAEDIMTAAAVEDLLQQELHLQPAAEEAVSTELSLGAVSAILSAINNLKSVIAENEVRDRDSFILN